MMMRAFVLVLLVSCRQEKQQPPAIETPSVVASAPASATASAAMPEASAPLDPLTVAKRWNDALDTSDMTTLASLYADKVKYYGVSFDRAALVKKVSDTLAKKPYHQDIKDVDHWQTTNGIRVQFHKHYGSHTEAGGYLLLDAKTHLIIEESDMTTDDTLLLAGKCTPYFETVTVTGELSRASATNDDFSVIVLDKRICLSDEDGGRSACEIPEVSGDVVGSLHDQSRYSFTGSFESGSRHQECAFDVKSGRPIR
jgi:hypothetical protein